VLPNYYVKRLAAKASAAKESVAAAVPNRATYGNAATSKGGRASDEHAAAVYDVRASEHCLTEHALLCVIVQARQGTGDGAGSVLTTAAAAA
jgi:hypothetical protein